MTVIHTPAQDAGQPLEQSQNNLLSEQQLTPQNRLGDTEVAGPIDTEAEVVGAEMGGLALGGPSSKFGVVASDVAETFSPIVGTVTDVFGGIKIDTGVDSYVKDIDAGELTNPNELQSRLRISTGRSGGRAVIGQTGKPITDKVGAPLFEDRKITPEQGELVERVATERIASNEAKKEAEKGFKSLNATFTYVADIVAGELTNPNELQGRLRISTGRSDGRMVLGETRKPITDKVGTPLYEDRKITLEQGELVDHVAKERTEVAAVQRSAAAAIKSQEAVTTYLEDIINGTITNPKELQGRLRISTGRSDGRMVQSETGQPIKDKVGAQLYEDRKFTVEQGEFVKSIAQTVTSSYEALPPEVKKSLARNELSEGSLEQSIQAVKAQRLASLVPAEIESCDQTLSQLEDLVGIVGRVRLSREFSETVSNNPEQAQLLINASKLESVADREFIRLQLRPTVNSAILKRTADRLLDPQSVDDTILTDALQLTGIKGGPTKDAESLIRFGSRRLLVQDFAGVIEGVSTQNLSYSDRLAALRQLKFRASYGGFDYAKERASLVAQGTEVLVAGRSAEIRAAFANKAKGASELISSILDLPSATAEDVKLQEELIESLAVYLIARRQERPDDFSALFSELSELAKNKLNPVYQSIQLGKNLQAAKALAANFKEVIAPIFQSLRGAEATRSEMTDYITARQGLGKGRESFVIDLERLSKQRALTTIERDYLESIEALSIFNPHISALACEAPGVTQAVLKSHFETVSQQTKESLQNGSYVPLLLIGLGPNGITSAGEILRLNPELAKGMLAVDSSEMPGGPFAVPRGAAWGLNSANERGSEEPTLPDSPEVITSATGVPEESTVRGYSSPLPFYPGERTAGEDTRPGSINTTVDYLPTPDDLSNRQYPTNDELALILQLQASMLLNKVALKTEVINIQPNTDPNAQGNKLVTLRMTTGDTVREVTIQTDSVVIASGLGKPNYGFKIEGSQAERVLEKVEQQPENEFPLFSDTLTAFKSLADREGTPKILGDKLIITGSGNSTDTLVEYIGGLFKDAENPSIRNVKKIIIVTQNEGSDRPRYAAIKDLFARNGRGNVLEFVEARVGDVRLSEDGKNTVLLNEQGQEIRDEDGDIVQGPAVVAATGFKGELDNVLRNYIGEGSSIRRGEGISRLTLPTNADVSVADFVTSDPSIILVGTASRADFENPDKLAQLPPDAREALIRNGAENAVAIGFRRPDDQAAMRLFVTSNETLSSYNAEETKVAPDVISVQAEPGKTAIAKNSPQALGPITPRAALPSVRRDVPSDTQILSPLFLQSFGRLRLTNSETTTLKFSVHTSKDENGQDVLTCSYDTGNQDQVNADILSRIGGAVSNPHFLAYWLTAKSSRRTRDGLTIQLSFRNGRLDLQQTYVETK